MTDTNAANRYRSKWREHIARTTGTNFHLNDNPRYATFTHPGLTPGDIDRYGNPTVPKLLHLSGVAFGFASNYPYQQSGRPIQVLNWGQLMHDRLLFLAVTTVNCSRSLYDADLTKWPLDVKVSFGGIGSTSVRVGVNFYIPGKRDPIFTRYSKYVSLDKKTRKPAPVPDWFRTCYQGREKTLSDFRFERFTRPSDTFVCRQMVMDSDTDYNNHTNYASYIKFGLDVLHLALYKKSQLKEETQSDSGKTKGRLPSQSNPSAVKFLTEDTVKFGVKRLEIVYLKESFEGDAIDVHVWQEDDARFLVKFSVEAMDKSVLSQFLVEYFTPSSQL